jgi:anti-sigma factor RsiW
MTCEDVERDLHAYVDRELAAESVTLVRDHVAGCPTCRRRVAELEALGRLVRATPYYAASNRLQARVSMRTTRTAWTRRAVRWATAAVLVVSVAGGITLVRSGVRSDTTVNDVVDGHVRSLMAEHLFDVRSTDQHTVKPWFAGKLDFSPPVSDLSAVGFPLVGGRLDYLAGRAVAALVYERQQHRINVFISPERGDAVGAIDAYSVRGFHIRHWTRNGMSFWAVSDLNDGELTQFAEALRGS